MHFDDASRALVELAASRHNAFHSSEVAPEINARRLRRAEQKGELVRLDSRVWSVAALGARPGQALRAAVIARSGAAACHRGAAWLHGWLPRAPRNPTVWIPRSADRARAGARLMIASAVDPSLDVVEVDHIRTLNKAATLCLLGRSESEATVEKALDEFTRTDSMVWLGETLGRLWKANCGGATTLARLLNDPRRIDGVTESWMERLLANLMSRADLPDLVLQYEVPCGGRRYRLDLALPEVRIGIEAHSRSFHWGERVVDADNVRDLALAAEGWEVLYITWHQIQRPEEFVDQVAAIARSRRHLFRL